MQMSVPTLGGAVMLSQQISRELEEEEEKKKKEKPKKPEKREIHRVFEIEIPQEHFLEKIGLKNYKLLDWDWDDEKKVLSLDVEKDKKETILEIPGEILARKLGYKGEIDNVVWDYRLKREPPFLHKVLFVAIREKAEGKLEKVL